MVNVAFNALHSGLGNNGGSRTIVYSAETITGLGYNCDILATNDKLNWFHHRRVVDKVRKNYYDYIIAVACTDVVSTIEICSGTKTIPAWYMRAHENWVWSDTRLEKMYEYLGKINFLVFVNSDWQQKYLAKFGIKAHIIYQGIDFQYWYNNNTKKVSDVLTIGCLYHNHTRKNWNKFAEIMNYFGTNFNYISYGSIDMSNCTNNRYISEYCKNPNYEELLNIYNKCDIWFAPTSNEGLHNPPMEAALCGSLIVCSDHPRNGMSDYAFDGTAIVYDYNNTDDMINSILLAKTYLIDTRYTDAYEIKSNCIQILKQKIGTRSVNMDKMMRILKDYAK